MQTLALLLPLVLPVGQPMPLERGLEAVDAGSIRADLTFIASDELAGRDTPSPGLRIAARYIRSRLQRLGFTPSGDDGFFARYELERAGLDLGATRARLGEEPLSFGEDYSFRTEGFRDFEGGGPLVWGGAASAEELFGLDLDGRWLLAHDAPAANNRERARRLAAAGVAGVVYLQPEDVGYRRQNRVAGYMRRKASRGGLRVVSGRLPEVWLTGDGAALLDEVDLDALRPGDAVGTSFSEERALAGETESHVLENVAGLWPGADEELRHEVIVISAHYDHIGTEDGEVYNGADDNGSGTCGMLALAEALAEYGPMRRSVLLLWVSGEEKGLLGSYAWTIAPTLPEGYRAVCDLNIDMIGRNAPDYLLITPSKARPEYNELVRMAEKNAPLEGFPELGQCDRYWRRSDHMNFSENLGIPVAFLFSDVHEDYHEPTDTVEKIDFDKIRRVTRLVLRMLDGLQGDELFGS